MTPTECVALCRFIRAAVPHQQWDSATPDVWYELGLNAVSYPDARAAVATMVKHQVFIDLHGIVEGVKKLRAARLEGFDAKELTPPDGLDPDDVPAWLAWVRGARAAIADGREPDQGQPAALTARPAKALAIAATHADRARIPRA